METTLASIELDQPKLINKLQEADHKALVQLCHTLLNTSEFLYVE